MCGISGIINKNNQPVDSDLIKKINDLIIHRGPDGEGYYNGPNFSFGHRRLSIIDLSDHGRQPMNYLDKYTITYNGEIYNYIEIRKELEERGYTFYSGNDTEVILAAYACWGKACLSKFNGMWAFAIYNSEENTIFLSRDRFGVKPLYYIDTPSIFAFGSEIKQMLALQSIVKANHDIVIEDLLTSNHGHTNDTFFHGVSSFPQSHCAYYDLSKHTYSTERFYDLNKTNILEKLSLDDATGQFKEIFESSVRLRLRSDVKVGTCLSGGLDSSATSGLASGIYHNDTDNKFVAIHAKSIDSERDESGYAKIVASQGNMDLNIAQPETEDFLNTIDEVVYTQEEPFGSPSMFMGWHVFELANRLGCKVMLNGQGGDEVLLGYERYFAAYIRSVSLLKSIPELRAQAKNSKLSLKEVLFYSIYFTQPAVRIQRLKNRSFLLPHYKKQHKFTSIEESASSFRNIENLQKHEIMDLQLPHLLRYEDRNSMRHSIETRLPFLDYRLVEYCLALPINFKIHNGWLKYILRKSMTDALPENIVWRKDKLGFEAPERTWIGSANEAMKEEIRSSKIIGQIIDQNRLLKRYDQLSLKEKWRYFSLAAWERKFNVSW